MRRLLLSILLTVSVFTLMVGSAFAEGAAGAYVDNYNKRISVYVDTTHDDAADAYGTEVAAIATTSSGIPAGSLILGWTAMCLESGKSTSIALFDVSSPTVRNLTSTNTFAEAEVGGTNDTDLHITEIFPFPYAVSSQVGVFYGQGRSQVAIYWDDQAQ